MSIPSTSISTSSHRPPLRNPPSLSATHSPSALVFYRCVDSDGFIFYFNSLTNESQWEEPEGNGIVIVDGEGDGEGEGEDEYQQSNNEYRQEVGESKQHHTDNGSIYVDHPNNHPTHTSPNDPSDLNSYQYEYTDGSLSKPSNPVVRIHNDSSLFPPNANRLTTSTRRSIRSSLAISSPTGPRPVNAKRSLMVTIASPTIVSNREGDGGNRGTPSSSIVSGGSMGTMRSSQSDHISNQNNNITSKTIRIDSSAIENSIHNALGNGNVNGKGDIRIELHVHHNGNSGNFSDKQKIKGNGVPSDAMEIEENEEEEDNVNTKGKKHKKNKASSSSPAATDTSSTSQSSSASSPSSSSSPSTNPSVRPSLFSGGVVSYSRQYPKRTIMVLLACVVLLLFIILVAVLAKK